MILDRDEKRVGHDGKMKNREENKKCKGATRTSLLSYSFYLKNFK